MESSEEHRLDSALRKGLKGIEGLPESARLADASISRYLREKFGEVLLNEYSRISKHEEGSSITERTSQAMDQVVLDAQKLYSLFELHLRNKGEEFWQGVGSDVLGSAKGSGKPSFSGYSFNTQGTPSSRKFYCVEGCEFEGEEAYLFHRDRGHHPVPA
jgi:hypothetical protein